MAGHKAILIVKVCGAKKYHLLKNIILKGLADLMSDFALAVLHGGTNKGTLL